MHIKWSKVCTRTGARDLQAVLFSYSVMTLVSLCCKTGM